jgi:hypothetical protein
MSIVVLFATKANQLGFCNVQLPLQKLGYRPNFPFAYLHNIHLNHIQMALSHILALA